jgi:hypothetical protein
MSDDLKIDGCSIPGGSGVEEVSDEIETPAKKQESAR